MQAARVLHVFFFAVLAVITIGILKRCQLWISPYNFTYPPITFSSLDPDIIHSIAFSNNFNRNKLIV